MEDWFCSGNGDDGDPPDDDSNVPEDPEDESEREIENWTDEDFYKVFPLYRALAKKRHEKTLAGWRACPAYQVRRASRVTTRLFDQELCVRTPDVTLRSTQLAVLFAIRECRGRERMREIARRLFMDKSTLTRAVHILERRGLVRRERSRRDGRIRIVTITEEGERVLTLNLRGWHASRFLIADRYPRMTGRHEEVIALRGVEAVFNAARRALHARGMRWEMVLR